MVMTKDSAIFYIGKHIILGEDKGDLDRYVNLERFKGLSKDEREIFLKLLEKSLEDLKKISVAFDIQI